MKTRNTIWTVGLLALAGTSVLGEELKRTEAPTKTSARIVESVPGKESRTLTSPVSDKTVQIDVGIYRLGTSLAADFENQLAQFVATQQEAKTTAPKLDREMLDKATQQWAKEGKAELIARPIMVAPAGTWTSFDMVRNITYPTKYDPATLPKEYSEQMEGVKSNESNTLIPPFPKDYEKRDLGLMMKLRPRISENGTVSVNLEVERTAMTGFADHGKPITIPKPGAIRKNAKPVDLLENQILLPIFLKHRDEFTVSSSGVGYHLIMARAPDAKTKEKVVANFGAEVAEDGLPPLLFILSARKLDVDLVPLAVSESETTPVESHSWKVTEKTRQSFGLKDAAPGPVASTKLVKKLAEFGIQLKDATMGPDWTFEAKASSLMNERVTKLFSVYEKNQHIFVTSKFIESAFPLEGYDHPIMTDAQMQLFVRTMNQKKGVDLLSAPSIMMRPFQEGKMEIIREFIYPVSYDPPEILTAKAGPPGEQGFPVTPATPIEFDIRNTGVELDIGARIFEDGSIELAIQPKVSEFLGFLNFGQPIYTMDKGALGNLHRICLSENRIEMPIFNRREIKTRVRIPDGATVLVGGLVKTDVQTVEDKVPVLGDLPIVGRMARSREEIIVNRYLYIMVSARVVDPAGTAVTKSD